MNKIVYWIVGSLLGALIVMQIHNALTFNPLFGLDGADHIEYLRYIVDHQSLPLPHEGWEFHQPPLYYLLSLPGYILFGTLGVQVTNVVIYISFLLLSYVLLGRIFRNRTTQLIGTLALAALPVTNYLVPMVSNEFFNGGIIGVTLLLLLLLTFSQNTVSYREIGILTILVIIGFYAKYTILTVVPAALYATLYLNRTHSTQYRLLRTTFITCVVAAVAISPLIIRNIMHYGKPLVHATNFFPYGHPPSIHDFTFFTTLSWIPKGEIFRTQDYSFIGGTWNTFWHDGYQLTVPVVQFHKMALALSLLGAPLTIIALFGLRKMFQNSRPVSLVLIIYTLSALAAYIAYNIFLPYPSEVKAFFMSGLPTVYAVLIASAVHYERRLRVPTLVLLVLQVCIVIGYFWIQPWWHIAR